MPALETEMDTVSDRTERLLTLLRDVTGALHGIARTAWHEFGLARPAALVMREVGRHPGITVSELARKTGLAKSNVSKSVESLVEIGFVDKRSDPSDRRLGRLYETDKARAHFHRMWEETLKRLSSVVEALSEEQVTSIISALEMLKSVALESTQHVRRDKTDHEAGSAR